MRRIKVISSNIKAVGYNIDNKILELEFNSGAIYHYKNVGLIPIVELVFADSLGSYFAKNIKPKFQCVKGESK